MKLRTARIVVRSMIGIVALFDLIALITKSSVAVVLMAAAAAVEVTVFFAFIKCPYCGRRLDRAGLRRYRSPGCGGYGSIHPDSGENRRRLQVTQR